MLYVDIPSWAQIADLFRNRGPAHVSLVTPTTPLTNQAQADRIAFKNQCRDALSQLVTEDKRQVRAMEEMLDDLVDDDSFWEFQAHSLVVFATPDRIQTFRLPNRLQPLTEVSDRFHVKPLLRTVTVPQSGHVLALAENSVRLVEVSGDLPATTVRVEGLPKDAASVARKASINDRSPSGRIQGSEGIKVRLTQFARRVDHSLRNVLAGQETPLILAATEPLQSIFRAVASYPHLAPHVLSTNPEALSDAELADAARGVLDQLLKQHVADFNAEFQQREKEGRATTDVAQAARAATQGAVQTLLVDIDDEVLGTMTENGAVSFADHPGPDNYDLVSEIAGRALLTRGRVLGVRKADIPRSASLAAVLRYPA